MESTGSYELRENEIRLLSGSSDLIIRMLESGAVNVRSSEAKDTIALSEYKTIDKVPFTFNEEENYYLINTDKLTVKVDKKSFLVSFLNKKGEIISEDHNKNISKDRNSYNYKALKKGEKLFGLGEKAGFLDKRGQRLKFWNYAEPKHFTAVTDNMYISIPFLISKSSELVYGLFYDNSNESFLDLGSENDEYYYFGAEGGYLNYYFFYGDNIKEVVEMYTKVTGKSKMPPLWSLGFHQSRWSYTPEHILNNVAKTFREKNIPCDSIHMDIDYMDYYKIFTFDKKKCQDPKGFFEILNNQGFKMITIIDPGVKKEEGYRVYEEGKSKNYFCKLENGEDFVGDVWPGGCSFPDFTNKETRHWWAELNKEFLNLGVKGIWNDLNEPSILTSPYTPPKNVIHNTDEGVKTHGEIHNVYANYEAMATLEGWKSFNPEIRPFILSRSGFAGIQKYAAVWTGDNTSSWDQLQLSIPMFINLGLSGIPFVGADVGGYAGDCTEELLVRWMQLGAFTPLFRNHSRKETHYQEPWQYSEKAEEIITKFIKLRYKLLPYFYNTFREAYEKGYPVLRPMFFDFEEDADTYSISDQFMLGDSILAAPVYMPGQNYRAVYLPEGKWYDYWSGEEYSGRQHILVKAELDTMPLFIKGGAVIPEYPVMNYVGEKSVDELTFNLYYGNSDFIYYEDDGESNDYLKEKFNKTRITTLMMNEKFIINLKSLNKSYAGGICRYKYSVHGLPKVSEVTADDIKIEFKQQGNTIEFTLPVENNSAIIIKY